MGQSKYDYRKEGILLCSTTSWGASRFLRRVAGGLPSFDSMIEKKQKTLLDGNDEKKSCFGPLPKYRWQIIQSHWNHQWWRWSYWTSVWDWYDLRWSQAVWRRLDQLVEFGFHQKGNRETSSIRSTISLDMLILIWYRNKYRIWILYTLYVFYVWSFDYFVGFWCTNYIPKNQDDDYPYLPRTSMH